MAQFTKVWLTILLCLGGYFLNAQTSNFEIKGFVTNQYDEIIEGASVVIAGSTKGTITNQNGFFSISNLLPGSYTIIVTAVDYTKQQVKINLKESQTHNFVLHSKEQQLEDVVIRGKTKNELRVEELRQSALNVTAIDLSKFANTTADVNQVLKQVTGVTIRESGGMGSDFVFRINGLAAKIFIDGVPMENFGAAMTLNNIPVNIIDRVEVYKGVVPAHLGTDALGGAVNIITKNKNRKFLDLSYSYGSFNTHQAALVGNYTDNKTGITVKANAFYNYSDNNYTMYSNPQYGVLIREAQNGKMVDIGKAKRFYDSYESSMAQIEVGAENKKWTDRFLVGLNYNQNVNQIQLGANVESVNGGLWSETSSWLPSLKYLKRNLFVKGLMADVYASYTATTRYVKDTARYTYDWGGSWREGATIERESSANKYILKDPLVRINLNYDFDAERTHSINLNYNYNSTRQTVTDLLDKPVKGRDVDLPSALGRHIVGLTYQGQFIQQKLIITGSAKYYGMDATKTIDSREFDSDYHLLSGSIYKERNFFGYPSGSIAARYRFTEDIGIKASVERAYSLPTVPSLFGDGQNILANFNLQPERSDNLNAGFFTRIFWGEHSLSFDGGGFFRKAKNFIMQRAFELGVNNSRFVYFNAPGVTMYGADAELRYAYKENFIIRLNGTYDKAIDSWKYTDSTNSQVSLTYQHQLPNRPWIYGNADVSWVKHKLFNKENTRLQLTYLFQYTQWFYLSWAHLGNPNSKDFIPAQYLQTVIATYSWKNNKYNLTAELRNIFDDRTYDNFLMQKPGRAFYLKARISIM